MTVAPQPLTLIPDPRVGLPDGSLIEGWSGLVRPRHRVTWCDPNGVGFRQPAEPEAVQLDGFVASLGPEWTLDGHRFLRHRDGSFFLDRPLAGPSPRGSLFATDRDTSLAWDDDAGKYVCQPGRHGDSIQLDGVTGIATSVEPSNWGSFLVRILPKAIMLREVGCDRLLAYCRHPRQREMLNLAGWSDEEIIPFSPGAHTYRFAEAVFPSEPSSSLYVAPTALRDLRRLHRGHPTPSRPVYISRREGIATRSGRTCLNGSEVERAMQALGVDIVHPDLLTAADQIELFARSPLVVGASGAGMFNTVFCQPDARVIDIESQRDWLFGHTRLFRSAGLRAAILLATSDPSATGRHRPFRVDVDALSDLVRAMTG